MHCTLKTGLYEEEGLKMLVAIFTAQFVPETGQQFPKRTQM